MDEQNIELKRQSVHQDIMFWASNSLNNLKDQKWSCPCYHARHLKQIHWINFCVGFMVSQPNFLFQCSTTMSLINKINVNFKLGLVLNLPRRLQIEEKFVHGYFPLWHLVRSKVLNVSNLSVTDQPYVPCASKVPEPRPQEQ